MEYDNHTIYDRYSRSWIVAKNGGVPPYPIMNDINDRFNTLFRRQHDIEDQIQEDTKLIAISGRGEGLGRPFLYSTTSRFLEYLGLKDIRDIPDMKELEKSLETIDLIPPAEHSVEAGGEPAPGEGLETGNTGEDDGS